MRNGQTFGAICLLLLINGGLLAQRVQVLTAAGTNACPGSLVSCASTNPVRLTVVTALAANDKQNLPFDPNDGAAKRRFKAFWIMGDGNYLQFPDSQTDAGSRTPPPYNYAAAGNYQVTSYLTGKYTNKNWPKRAVITVNNTASVGSVPTAFTSRLRSASQLLDLTSNQAIRKKNLTAFVISYARSKQASGVYFFYNGATNNTTKVRASLEMPLLRYANTEVPLYFSGRIDTAKIKSYETIRLREAGKVGNLTFTNTFSALSTKFRDIIYFPTETVAAPNMPAGFLEKRFFPVLQADSTFTPQDTLLNFLVVLTGLERGPNDEKLNSLLGRLSQGLSTTAPVNVGAQSPTAGAPPQYIQAAFELSVPYLVTFDPNQLTVEDIKPIGGEEYEVKFRLEMCNKGQGIVDSEMVVVRYSSSFHDFKSASTKISNQTQSGQTWTFTLNETIVGALPEDHESQCISLEFTARTDCNGVRSLWSNSPQQPVESCVVFSGAITDQPECHLNFPIDSTQFQVDGKGICCRDTVPVPTCPLNWLLWLLIFLVIIILFLIRKFFQKSQP